MLLLAHRQPIDLWRLTGVEYGEQGQECIKDPNR